MIRPKRMPTTPGEILREEYLIPLAMPQRQFAEHIGCDVGVINRIINGRSAVTARIALKLAAALDTTPEFWLNAQEAVDIWRASRTLKRLPARLLRTG